MTKALKEGDEEETCPPGRSQSRVMGSRTVTLLRVGDSCQYSTDCVTDQDCGGGKVGNCSLCYFFIFLVHLRARAGAWSPTLLSTGLDSVSVMMDGRLKLVRHYGTFSKHVQITFFLNIYLISVSRDFTVTRAISGKVENLPRITRGKITRWNSSQFLPNRFLLQTEQLSDGVELLWRRLSTDRVELLLSAPTSSWLGLGWRPLETTKACQVSIC